MPYSNNTEGRILGVDLSDLPAENMTALRQEAIAWNVSLPELLGSLISEKSSALVNRATGHERPQAVEVEVDSQADAKPTPL